MRGRLRRALGARLNDDRGDTLIEVVVSALVVGFLAIALFNGLIGATHATNSQRRYSQADEIAAQDEDRLRGMQIPDLSGLNQTRTLVLGGTTYTIVSTGQFVSDATGNASCTAAGTTTADYIKIASTVTWPDMGSRAPAVEEGIITPPAGGALSAVVVDGTGAGVSGMTVTVTGTGAGTTPAESAVTTSSGCAVFGGLIDGAYNVSVSQPAFVDRDGNAVPPVNQQATTVVAGATDSISFEFARAGTISVSFKSMANGVALPTSSSDTFVAYNSNMSAATGGLRVFGTPSGSSSNTYLTTVNSPTSVFPFPQSYSIYSGSCTADAPSSNGQSSDPTATVVAGQTTSLTIFQPALIVKVWQGKQSSPGSLVTTAPVVTLKDTGCGVERYPATVVATSTNGALRDPGQAYGQYSVCASASISGTIERNTATVNNNNVVAGTTANIYLGSGATGRLTGVCT